MNVDKQDVNKHELFPIKLNQEFFNASSRQINDVPFGSINLTKEFKINLEQFVKSFNIYTNSNLSWLSHNDMMKSHLGTILSDDNLKKLLNDLTQTLKTLTALE